MESNMTGKLSLELIFNQTNKYTRGMWEGCRTEINEMKNGLCLKLSVPGNTPEHSGTLWTSSSCHLIDHRVQLERSCLT